VSAADANAKATRRRYPALSSAAKSIWTEGKDPSASRGRSEASGGEQDAEVQAASGAPGADPEVETAARIDLVARAGSPAG
jgi:hypothetical protein